MENSDIDLKSLWAKRSTPNPSVDVMLEKIKGFQRHARRRTWKINIILGISSLAIIAVWAFYQPQFLSTKIGIVLMLIGMSLYMWFHNRSLSLYRSINTAQTNAEYLQHLMNISTRETFLQTRITSLYFILITTGLALYFIEYTTRMTTFYAILTYALSSAWIMISWFVFRTREIKKQRGRIEEMIGRVREISGQLEG